MEPSSCRSQEFWTAFLLSTISRCPRESLVHKHQLLLNLLVEIPSLQCVFEVYLCFDIPAAWVECSYPDATPNVGAILNCFLWRPRQP